MGAARYLIQRLLRQGKIWATTGQRKNVSGKKSWQEFPPEFRIHNEPTL
jgi:hypothetical protein